jgi:hypothetical protein
MNNKLAQFVSFINNIDLRYVRLAYFVLMFAFAILMKKPSDGGTGPI